MTSNVFSSNIKKYVDEEIGIASGFAMDNDLSRAFHYLERAHVLGQAVTLEHTRVHWLMLKIGWKKRDWREIFGQIFRIVGASTKTPFGIYPTGNTGGSDIWFFQRRPIPNDLQKILDGCGAIKNG